MSDIKRNSGDYNSGFHNSGDRNSGDRNSGFYNSGDRNSGDCNSGDRNSGDLNSGDRNSGDCNSGDLNSGDLNSGNLNSGDLNSGNLNSGDRNSGDCNSGDRNSGDLNSGDRNSGDYNSGDLNSGFFNTNTPKVRLFNQDSNLGFDSPVIIEVNNIIYNKIKTVCIWITEEKMNEEEKEQYPSYKTTGGYLKRRDYQYCWLKGWGKMSEDDKEKIINLPNFCPKIFNEITGIDTSKPDNLDIIEVSGVKYKKLKT